MKNKALLTVIFGITGFIGFKANSSRMVCVPENFVRTGQDQGQLACRYHWAHTTLDLNKKGERYRCYFQFTKEGIKFMTVPEFGKLYSQKNESDNILGYLPAQRLLKNVTNKTGNQIIDETGNPKLTTQGASPIWMVFSKPYNAESFAILKKANSKPIHIEELKKTVDDYTQVETSDAFLNNLSTLLPCLGCIDLDESCKKK